MKLYIYNIAPLWWPLMSEEEKKNIHIIEVEYNTDTSAQLLNNKDEDIVRPILNNEGIELKDKEPLG